MRYVCLFLKRSTTKAAGSSLHSMRWPPASVLLLVLVMPVLSAQAPPPRVEFEVASIRPSDPILSAADASKIGLHIDGAQVNLGKLSLNDYLGMAYKVKLYQIS